MSSLLLCNSLTWIPWKQPLHQISFQMTTVLRVLNSAILLPCQSAELSLVSLLTWSFLLPHWQSQRHNRQTCAQLCMSCLGSLLHWMPWCHLWGRWVQTTMLALSPAAVQGYQEKEIFTWSLVHALPMPTWSTTLTISSGTLESFCKHLWTPWTPTFHVVFQWASDQTMQGGSSKSSGKSDR